MEDHGNRMENLCCTREKTKNFTEINLEGKFTTPKSMKFLEIIKSHTFYTQKCVKSMISDDFL